MVELNYESRHHPRKMDNPFPKLESPEQIQELEAAVQIDLEQAKVIRTNLERVRDTLKAITNDEDINQIAPATLRTIVNSGITIADTIPGIGEFFSWGADLVKMTHHFERYSRDQREQLVKLSKLGAEHTKELVLIGQLTDIVSDLLSFADRGIKNIGEISYKIDASRDASVLISVASEGLELMGVGAIPTHVYETLHQGAHDIPRALRGIRNLLTHIRDGFKAEGQDFIENEAELTEAMAEFEVKPPQLEKGGQSNG